MAVEKGSLLINMDSQAPNQVAQEYLPQLLPGLTAWRREQVWGIPVLTSTPRPPGSGGVCGGKGRHAGGKRRGPLFPTPPPSGGEAPAELIRCQQEGYRACALFVVQMQGISYFTPNRRTHPEFAQALEEAAAQGVRLEAWTAW